MRRTSSLLEQGIPVPPMPVAEARQLRLRRADNQPLLAAIEPEGFDEQGRVRWVRVTAQVAVPARGHLPVVLERGEAATPPAFSLRQSEGAITVETPDYQLAVRAPGHIDLRLAGRPVLAGPWALDLVGDARAILWGTYLRDFELLGVSVEEQGPHRATILLRGRCAKNQRKAPTSLEPGREFAAELRLHVTSLSPVIGFAWRVTNLTGSKTWLQRYALRLPLSDEAAPLTVKADFLEDLGPGAGVRREGRALLIGGLDMPPDGVLYGGTMPAVHRLFHHGMSRTFTGTLVPPGREPGGGLDLVLPPQYYSDTGALPELGDPVGAGEFGEAVRKAAEWLLRTQWRGTLWWGEWWREWDETRNMGVQEAGNGHSVLAPLYHYWRTGDARFLDCARRSFAYTVDVQLFKGEDKQGRMFHTRRHLFDELDWIHPRYQRATGGLVASHVFLAAPARREIVQTIRSFHDRMFDERGVPHDWDVHANRRSGHEAGVDTSNFMEALIGCYRETGDRTFLERARTMSRWTAARWGERGRRPGDDWNWNLINYALRGLVALYEVDRDPAVGELAAAMTRAVLANPSTNGMELIDGVGGGELHFTFYHAWISTRVAKFAPAGAAMTEKLLGYVRREVARQRPDGLWALERGSEAGLPTRWTSYYEAKSLVAYVPVLAAHVRAQRPTFPQPPTKR